MRIEGISPIINVREISAPRRRRGAGRNGESVSISEEGKFINFLRSRLREIEIFRKEEVEAISRKLASGEYYIDLNSLANSLIEEVLE
jgi:flagellar biosynthesis anti-sigma factor FlgM